ncbi:MAG: Ig-like domain-containing protein [Bacteroidales bacterium]|jgi:uncharacterized protein YjdB|nr:Ig-like domain-containing protein [Bacteroidales bacterium]
MKKILFLSLTITLSIFHTLNAQVKLNEIQSSNATTVTSDLGNYADWIELYNTGSATVDISGYYITDDNDEPRKWQVPSGTTISSNNHLLIWCDGLTTGLHTNFNLSGSKGEKLYIYSSSMLLLDTVTFPTLTTDYTYGRVLDGTGEWARLASPTPDAQNDPEIIQGAAPAPAFSIPAGFYSSSQNVGITSSVPNAVIRYTTDGTEPTESSPIYTGPITVDKTTDMTLKYGYNRDNNTGIQEYHWAVDIGYPPVGYYDNENQEFGAMIKAKAFHDDYSPSKTATSTFFINMRRPSLPIISITTDKAGFFSADQGIYIQGTNGATETYEGQQFTANWHQDDWERKVFVEYFDENGEKQFGVNAGIQTMGAVSRNWDQKSLKISLRNEYGDSELNYPLFGDDGQDSYDSFYLRNSGNDWEQGSLTRDAIIQYILRGKVNLETQAYKPVVMYLNGEYFGIINMRERYGEDHLANLHDFVDPDEVDILKINSDAETFNASEGDSTRYFELVDFLNSFSMTDETYYNYVIDNYVDKDNIINYYIGHIYCQNTDWPGNNTRLWRPRMQKGKFRFLFYDTDFGYGLWGGGPSANNLSRTLSSSEDHAWATIVIRSLMENPTFESEFIQRFSYMINTIYTQDRLESIANSFENTIANERDNYSDEEWTRSVSAYGYNVNDMISWGIDRIGYMRDQINSEFGNEGYSYLTVNFTESNGSVYLCSLPVEAGYSGRQYENTPIRLVAEAKDGYQFVRWKSGSTTLSTEQEYFLTITGDYTIEAEFESRTPVTGIHINEIMASNSLFFNNELNEYEDWIEIYNPGTSDIDLAGLYISDRLDSLDKHKIQYGSPELTTVPAGGYLILWADKQTHAGANHLNFNLARTGESVVISQINASGTTTIIDQITYGVQNINLSFGRYPDGSSNQIVFDIPTPDASNQIQSTAEIDGLVITECMAKNAQTITEETGGYADWIEIYNSTDEAINIGGLFVTNDLGDLNKYMIPANQPSLTTIQPSEYYILWADEQIAINPNHVGFKLKAEFGDIAIVQLRGSENYIIDQVSYANQGEDIAYGRFPSTTSGFRYLPTPTPGDPNSNNATISIKTGLTINELLAANTSIVKTEYNKYSDYIEFYNASSTPIDLGGLFVSDSLSYSLKYRIPRNNSAETTVQPGEWITFWANSSPENGSMHLDFGLDVLGEEVVLSQVTENGIQQLDYIIFEAQTQNISYGRFPETTDNWELMTPTYNAENQSTSASTSLATLTTSIGEISPSYSNTVSHYICYLPQGTSNPPVISATPMNENASLTITQATSLSEQATVDIISADGNNTATYTVSFELAPSDDATLSVLSTDYGTLSPVFSPSINTYTIDLPSPIIPLLTAQANQENASVEINYGSSIENTTSITVTAESGNTNTYFISYNSQTQNEIIYSWVDDFNNGSTSEWDISGSSTDFYAITATNGEINLSQAAEKTTYRTVTYTLPAGFVLDMENNPNPVLSLDVYASEDSEIRIDLKDINSTTGNSETISHTVTGGTTETLMFDYDGVNTGADESQINTIVFYTDPDDYIADEKEFIFDNLTIGIPLSANADLASLSSNIGTLSPTFSANTTEYSLTIPHNTTTIPTISANADDVNALVEISQASSVTGEATIRVTAENNTTQTYTVTIERELEIVEGYVENIIQPNLAGFSESNATYELIYGGGYAEISYNRSETSGNDSFIYNISEADAKILNLSNYPYVAIRARTTTLTDMRIDLFDGNEYVSTETPVSVTVNGPEYTTYVYNFANKLAANLTVEDIRGIKIYFDKDVTTVNSGSVFFDKIMFGSEVDMLINHPPVISTIPNQTQMRGETFSNILLDNYVSDDNTSDGSLIWSHSSSTAFALSISSSHALSITPLDSEWMGSEEITLTVADTEGESSSITITISVTELQIPAESVTFTQTSISLDQEQTRDLHTYLTIYPETATIESIIWSVDNPNISITENGIISHSLEFGSESGTISVTVLDKSGNEYIQTMVVVITGCPIHLETVTLSPSLATVTEEQTLQLSPVLYPTDACIQNISYSSDEETIATVSETGLVSGLIPGTAIITISINDGFSTITSTRTVTVEKDCSGDISLSINKEITDIIETYTETLIANISPDDECTENNVIIWESLDTDYATVNSNGIVSAIAEGTARIVASTTGNGITSDTCIVNVLKDCYYGTVTVTLDLETESILTNSGTTLTYSISHPDACNSGVTWESTEETIATVDENGEVSAINIGETYIICRSVQSPEMADTCILSVEERLPTSIELPSTLTVYDDENVSITATVLPENADNKNITWETLNQDIISLTQTGDMTALEVGTDTIRVTSLADPSIYAECIVTILPVEADTIIITPDTLELFVYDESSLSVTFEPINTTNQSIVWSIANTDIATLSEGTITAVSAGETIITAIASNGAYSEAVVIVSDIEPTDILLSETSLSLFPEEIATLSVLFTPLNTTDTLVSWTSNNTDIATVSEGIVTSHSVGETIITVTTNNGLEQTCDVTVSPVIAESITLNTHEVSLIIDDTQQLIGAISPDNTTDQTISWHSENETIATVDETGLVTAHNVGQTEIITTTHNNLTDTCIVYVEETVIEVDSVVLSDENLSILLLSSGSLSAEIYPFDASNKTVIWKSANTNIATVSQSGTITPQQTGETYIVATTSNNLTDTCFITIQPNPITTISLSQSTIDLAQNASSNLEQFIVIEPSEAEISSINWSTESDNITLDANGMVSNLVDFGTETAIVTLVVSDTYTNEFTETITLNLTGCATELTSVTLSPAATTIVEGGTLQLSPTHAPTNACIKFTTYESLNETVASISQTGLITAHLTGETTIEVTVSDGFNTYSDSFILTVEKDCSGDIELSLSETSYTITRGFSFTLTTTIIPDDECTTDNVITWISSNPEIASVENGVVSAHETGTTTITASTDGTGITVATCEVTVISDCFEGTVSIEASTDSISLYKTETALSSANIIPTEACDASVTWTSSNTEIATVNDGTITALSTFGECYIICSSNQSPEITDTIVVSVIERLPSSVSLTETLNIYIEDETILTATIEPINADDKSLTWTSSNLSIVGIDASGTIIGNSIGTATITATTINNISASCEVTVLPIPASSFSLSESVASIFVYDELQLNGTILPDNTTNTTISWSSSDSNIATVDENGKVTGISSGQTTITARTHNDKLAECIVTVKDIQPTHITLEIGLDSMNVNTTQTINVTFDPENTTAREIEWSTSNVNLATVNDLGQITALQPGTVIFTATTSNDISQEISIVVRPIETESISLNTTAVNIRISENQQLIASIYPENTTDKTITWTSADTSIATVNNSGKILGKSIGTTGITATTANGKTATCNVTVRLNTISVDEVIISQDFIDMFPDASHQVSAEIVPDNATNKTIVWSSNKISVATVDQNGVITSVSPGTALVIATASNGIADTCTVTVMPIYADSIIISTQAITLSINESQEITAEIYPENATQKTIFWSVENTDIASVSTNGTLTGNNIGATELYAQTLNGSIDTCIVTIIEVSIPADSIHVSPTESNIDVDETITALVTFYPEATTNKTITWTSNDENIASVNQYAKITGVNTGTTIIRAKSANNKTAEIHITVNELFASSIELEASSLIFEPGQTHTIGATISPIKTTNKTITWTSENEEIARVNEFGLITAVSPGTTLITATTSNELTTSCEITVTEIYPTEISIIPPDKTTILIDETLQLNVEYTPTSTTATGLLWSSSNTDIATVNEFGEVTGINEGVVTINVSSEIYQNVNTSINISVSIYNEAPVVTDIPPQVILIGEEFPIINLNDYFTDDNTSANNIRWSANTPGVISLQINSNGDVTATCTQEGWLGSETITIRAKDEHGLITSYPVIYTISDGTAIHSVSLQTIRVYPNPSTGIFTLAFETVSEGNYTIQLISPEGKTVFAEKSFVLGSYSHRFTNNSLAKGIYTIRIQHKKQSITRHILIQ